MLHSLNTPKLWQSGSQKFLGTGCEMIRMILLSRAEIPKSENDEDMKDGRNDDWKDRRIIVGRIKVKSKDSPLIVERQLLYRIEWSNNILDK
jgi:hypothetical protein